MMQRGNKGPEVLQVQRALAALNYDVGRPDGDFGYKTEGAVKGWQQTRYVTGKLTPDEVALLTAAAQPAGPETSPDINRDPALLHPYFRAKVEALVEGCRRRGVAVALFEGYRSPVRQAALYAQGRTAPGDKVTNAAALDSWHQYGLAGDMVVDGDAVKPGYQWDWGNKKGEYEVMGAVARELGLEWAGSWRRFPEKPHVQITFGLTLNEAKEMWSYYRNLKGVWAELDAGRPVVV
jgi:hypothetical protein